MAKKNVYSIFGLNIETDIVLFNAEKTENNADVSLKIGDVPKQLYSTDENNDRIFQVAPGKILGNLSNAAYYIADGKEIIVTANFKNLDENKQSVILEAFSAYIWLQRGAVLFHASAVEKDGKALVFMGEGGAGKSTTSFFFSVNGYRKLADDLCIVYKDANLRMKVITSCIKQNLTIDTIKMLNLSKEHMRKIDGEEKYTAPVDRCLNGSADLEAIFFIKPQDRMDEVQVNGVRGINKLMEINKHTLKRNEARKLTPSEALYENSIMEIAKTVEMYEVVRPVEKNTLEEMFRSIEKKIVNRQGE